MLLETWFQVNAYSLPKDTYLRGMHKISPREKNVWLRQGFDKELN